MAMAMATESNDTKLSRSTTRVKNTPDAILRP